MRAAALLGFVAASWAASAHAANRPVVAVLPLIDKSGLPPARIEGLSDYLRVKVASLGKVDVVDKGLQEAETQRLIAETQAESYRACVDESCQIPLGKQLAAQYLLRGTLQRFEATTVLALELIDVASAASTAAVTERVVDGPDGVLSAIERAVVELGRRLDGQGQPLGGMVGIELDDEPEPEPRGNLFGAGGLGVHSSSVSQVFGVWAEAPPEDPPSPVRGVVYLSVAAALIAGGLALDLAPDSAHNGGLDFLDLVPIGAYLTAFFFGAAGVGNLW